jgi:two-component system, NtrC family, sensor histidine kinase HydH
MLTENCTASDQSRSRGYTRISVCLFLVGAVLLGAGIYGAWQVYRLQRRGDAILSSNVAGIRAAEELETIVREFEYRLKRSLATGEDRHLSEIRNRLPDGRRWLAETDKRAESAREQQLVVRMRRGYKRVEEQIQQLEDLEPHRNKVPAIQSSLAGDVIPNQILVYLQKYIQHNEDEISRNRQRNQANARQLMFGLLLLGSFGGVAGLLAGAMIARSVSRTIVQLSLPIRDTAGKLNEVVGPVAFSAQPGFDDLQAVLQRVSEHVSTVVERLQEREREMLRAEQLAAVGQLAAGMAHELRNPLTAAKAVLQLTHRPEDLSERDLQVLKQEIRRLEQSVQTVIDFARPPQPEKRPVDLRQLMQQAVDLVARRAQLQRILVDYEPPAEPVTVVADATQLRQVLLNLILNALDAVSRDGVVRLELQREPAATEWNDDHSTARVLIRVRDSGPGLPVEIGERIFDPFVSTKDIGLGLGLSICRRIVEAHRGRLDAADDSEGGAVFTVCLPQTPADSPEWASRAASPTFADRTAPARHALAHQQTVALQNVLDQQTPQTWPGRSHTED